MNAPEPYWYLASYPKSGNTWCRVFITELRRLAGLTPDEQPLRLNDDVATGAIVSNRVWLDDQLGIDSSDLSWAELDHLRGRVGQQRAVFSGRLRYHKVHDAFISPDSGGRPVVPLQGCQGAVLLLRHPADVAVSLSHFYGWPLERAVAFLLDEQAALCASSRRGGPQVRQFLGSWAQHLHSWIDQSLIPVLPLRYEDLLQNPLATFTRLAQFLALPSEATLIEAAAANSSIERLQALETKEGGFRERPASCARFFRSGRSGEGGEQLSARQLLQLQEAFGPTLHHWGYAAEGLGRSPQKAISQQAVATTTPTMASEKQSAKAAEETKLV